ncbi:hypothetical protein GKE56_12440 [Nostocoides sp. HKS02]|nr:hypothetical protein GKE56_12440 [Tetrasphaera sp. HKS02]
MMHNGESEALERFVAAMTADAHPSELSGFDRPLASYRSAFPVSRPSRPTGWRRSMLSSLVGTTLGATIAGVAVALGGTAVVAYTAAIPPSAHQSVHVPVGTPTTETETDATETATETADGTKTSSASGSATPVGPDATGPAAFGLCTAWTHHQSSPGASKDSVAFKNLATAAGGEGNIAAYCATITHPGTTSHPTAKATSHPGATSHRNGKGKGKGKPSSHPTGKPSTVPPTPAH